MMARLHGPLARQICAQQHSFFFDPHVFAGRLALK